MSLPRKNRLKRQQDFTAVYKFGRRCSTPHLTIRVLSQESRIQKLIPDSVQWRTGESKNAWEETQIGISISRKVSKRAVIRNRIKRRIQAVLRQLLPQCQKGCLIAIVVHPKAIQCEYRQFLRELEKLLVDAEVINGN
ncbi:MAG: ribonuclease P protein component [Cyanobacteria bacterium P01_F01_bin.86]